MTKKLDKVADDLEARWYTAPAPKPLPPRIQPHTHELLRELVDLLRDNIK